ncbi:multiple organellar RNA editing factor 8, chloroplastic/mitochondrial [Brachypodium distachyon]|uniref:MORF/ORRM1/DAG-like MORF domain-containing protein n=1 Tax=Brachypodium distachyon TaxID=15368 RepID=I1I8Z4_BRADI|nr:multiple organellar RNA editing factor 8, chloroplastic/mitochondrial [Brachypodium distachyon]KQJ99153.1 hypothetical protein BRADI_3g41430v3 [Brachypodium distachyon]|eukprot:XP_010235342.1 multiple organellar RNA editing factor 8, chloroplastic/mitochondrial [Brachypodium distachyon]
MAMAARAVLLSRLSPLPAAASRFVLLRPLAAAATLLPAAAASTIPAAAARGAAVRCFATQPATSSLRDSSPNWSNRPPKETILLDGCDFEHWLVVMEPPPGDASNPEITRDEIIDSYIKTLAQIVGSEEEAKQKIYSVSTRHYFAFGALVSEELSYKLKELPKVRWVLPDSYLDVRNKDYGGEPFINGEAVPYDPKYHEEWVRNNARANERSRRTDRPRNFDRSRNFERRRENQQNFQNRDAPPGGFNSPPGPPPPPGSFNSPPPPPGQGFNSPPPPPGQGFNSPPPPPGQGFNSPPPPPGQNRGMPPPPPPLHTAGGPPHYQSHMQNPQAAYTPGGSPHMPNPQAGYTQGSQPGYAPGGAQNYQQSGAPGYQGGPSGYQGNQGGPPGYQGNQGGPPGYQGSGNQGGPPGYQGGPGPAHPGSNPGYQGGNTPPHESHGGRFYGNAPDRYNQQ